MSVKIAGLMTMQIDIMLRRALNSGRARWSLLPLDQELG